MDDKHVSAMNDIECIESGRKWEKKHGKNVDTIRKRGFSKQDAG
jgi:hypothetical protein